ncbi:PHP domain-containing protein [Bacillus sp. FJAT-45037]|uniref:PHP domain-containing protein n=1 Tax=Bacillus sp. FJAT-45037 TaxID=2011007 RepID=UPI000C24BE65|nr:PHP domain-containing protein [Bacillus sp. FJAT-45037]
MSNFKNSDLHMHSTASDGNYKPKELMIKCKEAGLEIVSLTDHDTFSGLREAMDVGVELGLTVIPGIELSTKSHGRSVHILGYGLDYHDESLLSFLEKQKQYRSRRLDHMLNKLASVNINLTRTDVLFYVDGGSIGRPHVAKAMIDRGYVETVAEAFDGYLGEGKPGFVEKEKEMTVEEAIKLIHQYGGLAVVAHPTYYQLDDEIEHWVIKWGLDGVEVFHRDHDQVAQQKYLELCHTIEAKTGQELLKTGGSDFHDEEYGRVPEPLGITRLDNSYAKVMIKRLKESGSL